MRELPKSVIGICVTAVSLFLALIGGLKVGCEELILQSVWESAGSAGNGTEFKQSAPVVAMAYCIIGSVSLSVALFWSLLHAWLVGRLLLSDQIVAVAESGPQQLMEALLRIELDVNGLAAEIHGEVEYASTLKDWKEAVAFFSRQCRRYEKSAIDELMASMTSRTRDRVEDCRKLIVDEIAEAIVHLESLPTDDKDKQQSYKAQFGNTANQLWGLASQLRRKADQCV